MNPRMQLLVAVQAGVIACFIARLLGVTDPLVYLLPSP